MLSRTHRDMHPHALTALHSTSRALTRINALSFHAYRTAHALILIRLYTCSLPFTPLHTHVLTRVACLSHASHTRTHTCSRTSLHFTRSHTRRMVSHTHPTHAPTRAHCTLHFTPLHTLSHASHATWTWSLTRIPLTRTHTCSDTASFTPLHTLSHASHALSLTRISHTHPHVLTALHSTPHPFSHASHALVRVTSSNSWTTASIHSVHLNEVRCMRTGRLCKKRHV